jgi:hypothetical protein
MANGRILTILESVRGRFNTQTDAELQDGNSNRVDRLQTANNRGLVGPRRMRSFPTFADDIFIGHIPTYVKTRGVTLKPGNVIDDNTHIQSTLAGNPLP